MFGQWAEKCIVDFNYHPLPTDDPEKTYQRFCKFRQADSDAEKWEVANDGLNDLKDNGLYEALEWAAEECYARDDPKWAEKYINKIITSFLVPGLFLKAKLCLDVGFYKEAAYFARTALHFSNRDAGKDYIRFNQMVLVNLGLADEPEYFSDRCALIYGDAKAKKGAEFSPEEKLEIGRAFSKERQRLETFFNPKVGLTPSVIIHIEESTEEIPSSKSCGT
ncbi:MAG: hypothetical protein K0R12_861 [Gammaproteobacteria bacterium]|nr:hypothetical protein [Gammaproteobacteria bacterium]